VNILLEFGHHSSMYEIGNETAEELQGMYDTNEMAHHVIEHGRLLEYGRPAPIYHMSKMESYIILDTTVDSPDKFLDDLATELVIWKD